MFLRRSILGFNSHICSGARRFESVNAMSFGSATGTSQERTPSTANTETIAKHFQEKNVPLTSTYSPEAIKKHIQEKNVRLFEASLRALSIRSKSGKDDVHSILPLVTSEFINSMNLEAVFVLNSLSVLGIRSFVHQDRTLIMQLLQRVNSIELNNQQVSTVLTAISRMELSYPLTKGKNKTLKAFLGKVMTSIPTMNAREIVQALQSLQTMEVDVTVFPKFYRDVTTVLTKVHPDIKDEYKAALLFSLGRLGFHSMNSDPEWRQIVHKLAEDALSCNETTAYLNSRFKGKGSVVSAVAMGLSSMYLSFSDFPTSLQEKIISAFHANSKSEFAFVVASSGRMGIDFQALPYPVRFHILQQTETYLSSFDLGEVNKILLGLMGMKLQYAKLDTDMREKLHTLLLRAIPMCEFFTNESQKEHYNNANWMDSVRLIQGLGQMGANWAALPVSIHQSIFGAITHASPLKSTRLTSVLQGLSHMQMRWSDVSDEVRNSLFHDLSAFGTFRDSVTFLVPALQALAKMKAHWHDLPTNNLEYSLVSNGNVLNEVGFSTVLLSLGQLQAAWSTLEPETRELVGVLLKKHARKLSEQMLASAASGIGLMTFDCVPGADPSVDEIHQILVNRIVKHTQKKSAQCDNRFFSQIAMYRATLSIQPQYAELTAQLEKELDSIHPDKFKIPVLFQKELAGLAKSVCYNHSTPNRHYSVEIMQSHLKYKALVVQMSVYKQVNNQPRELIGFFLTNGGNRADRPRRSFQMMKMIYGHHMPDVPFYATAVSDKAEFVKMLEQVIRASDLH